MKFKHISALIVAGFAHLALATSSTINPAVPAQSSPLTSAPIRQNFGAAYNDINAIWATLQTPSLSTYLLKSANLSDVASASAARANLGLGTAATKNIGTAGAYVPMLNTANAWSSLQTFNAISATSATITGAFNVTGNISATNYVLPTTGAIISSDFVGTGLDYIWPQVWVSTDDENGPTGGTGNPIASVTVTNTSTNNHFGELAFNKWPGKAGSPTDTWAFAVDPARANVENFKLRHTGTDVLEFAADNSSVTVSTNILLDGSIGEILQTYNLARTQVLNIARVVTSNYLQFGMTSANLTGVQINAGSGGLAAQFDGATGDSWFPNNTGIGAGSALGTAKLTVYGASSEGTVGQTIRLGVNSTTDYSIRRNNSTGTLEFDGSQTGSRGFKFLDGSVAVGATDATASALVDMQSTTQGMLPPRMTTTQKNAISSPASGLVLFDTNLNRESNFFSSAWHAAVYGDTTDTLTNKSMDGGSNTFTNLPATGLTGLVAGANGGTGVANTGKTITLGGNITTGGALTTSGAFATTFTMTSTTGVTFPTSGTLVGSSDTATVTNTMLATMAANTVKANATASSASPTDIALSASQLLGRGTSGNVAPITLGTNVSMSGTTLNVTGAGITSLVKQNTTSGTQINYTGIPSTAHRVTILLAGVSTNGSNNLGLQIGSGSLAGSGYVSAGGIIPAGTPSMQSVTNYFVLGVGLSSAAVYSGTITLTLLDASTNTWVESHNLARSDSAQSATGAGDIVLSGALDRVSLITSGLTDTFDAGVMNVLYE